MIVFGHPKLARLPSATAYCCTAASSSGEDLADLRASCRRFAFDHGLRITAWAAEATPDDLNERCTSLLRYAIEFANDPETDLLLIAESRTLIRSWGAAVFLARSLSPEDTKILQVPSTRHRRLGS
ncbi:hypothetical protein SAMN05421504_102738 [Amycolatopsis xylanica]|uniref:Uncharacterized protein n=1 Tax=Amycolatopsis xylanica TaxID=589385 RepID=A0A1H2ZZW0_9PSEU|nr:hypothetical protein [Amycolatopsis xylanica]SDX22906.1 hypothetical protein SAMN05421504_102738 [Amycolatopsis xylanica]